MLLHFFITKLMPNLKKAKPVFIYRKKRIVIFQLDYSFKLTDRNIIELSLCCINLSDQLNILLKSYIGEYVVSEYSIFSSMNQIKFVHDVIDWKTFAKNFEQQHSNASIMIFKSKERSYVQNLLQEKQPKTYEYEKYLDYAL